MKLMDTIAAVGTPYGKGGVALIRISGSDALSVAEKIFLPAGQTPLGMRPHGQMTYGTIQTHTGVELDDGMAVYFRAPHSFTGEDTVEITCHGGILITERVLRAVLLAGARLAEAGEFTRRAYVFGKLRLSQAEALGNLLEAKSDSQITLARNGMKGHLSGRTEQIYADLRSMLTSVYAAIDFPDEDLSEMSREQMIAVTEQSLSDIRTLAATYSTGKAVSEGIPTVICGRTNAGKSSVYNRILGYDAAIVTDIEGTTRDVLHETATLGKTVLRLCDTAGLRQTDDVVETIGIERTRREMKQAGLILAVFDSSRSVSEEDRELVKVIQKTGIPAIALLNKIDRKSDCNWHELHGAFQFVIPISAKEGTGFSELTEAVDGLFIDETLNLGQDAIVTGARQYAALETAAEALEHALADLRAGVPLDLCCVGMEQALLAIGEVDGRELGEEIVAEIFSRFCVGK